MALDEQVLVGDLYRVSLRTPEDIVDRLFAEVVWCGGGGFDYVAGLRILSAPGTAN